MSKLTIKQIGETVIKISNTAPGVNDDESLGFGVGSQVFDDVNEIMYICTDATNGAAVWEAITGSSPNTLCVVKAYKNLLGSGASPFIANTEVFDTTNSYDNTTGIFTAPRAGYYLITGSFAIEGHSDNPSLASVQIIKNGSTTIDDDSVRFNGTEGSADFWKRRLKVTTTTNLAAGETIQFNVAVSPGTIAITGGVSANQITITELR